MFGATKIVAMLLEDLRRERERSAALVADLLAMKREGYTLPPPPIPIPQLPDEVREALAEIPDEARMETERWAWAQQGVSPARIAQQIREGQG